MEEVKDTIFEEREEELMISIGDDDSHQTLRKAHFLKPTMDKSLKNLPPSPLSMSSNTRLNQTCPKVRCCAWRLKHLEWNKWVDTMHIKHHRTWKKSGIFEAVMCSKIMIRRKMDLVCGVAEKWCSKTNTFVFPWGEATITLEDMLVLGGYSVLGDSVLARLKNQEMKNTEATLIRCYDEVRVKVDQYPQPNQWIKYFVSGHTAVEHEAFLCLWLSKYVFPNTKNIFIDKALFPAAIRLARGIRIALAQPVLACIYRELGTLKDRIDSSKKYMFYSCSQLHLVQVWVWERFTSLSPKPLLIENDEPRLAKWNGLKKKAIVDVGRVLASDSEHYKWRPYVTKMEPYFCKFYRENEGWVVIVVGSAMDSEVDSFARCVRVSKLVGIDCSEQYHPHRVAMQFGLDQDVPQYDQLKFDIRPTKDEKVFIPSRLFQGDVTKRYFDWWRNTESVKPVDALAMPIQKKRRTLSICTACAKEPRQADVTAVNDSDDDEQLTLNQLVRNFNAEKVHVGHSDQLLDGAPQIPSPCNACDLMEITENQFDELQVQASETVVMESEKVASVTEITAHQEQDFSNTRAIEARVQIEEMEELEARQTQALQDVAAVNKLLSSETIFNESENVIIEGLEVAAVEAVKENEKEIEIIDLESDELIDSHAYKVFMKSGSELAARISRLEEMAIAARAKVKGKVQKKA